MSKKCGVNMNEYILKDVPFSELEGKILKQIIINNQNPDVDDSIVFITNDGLEYVMHHYQDCCEEVFIDDISGDIKDLINTPILKASKDTGSLPQKETPWDESFTWTFYNLRTIKGDVQIKWYGTSNGYYSEEAHLYSKMKYL